MRQTKISILPFQVEESPGKQMRAAVLARPTVRQPLLKFRAAELQKKKTIREGLKDLCGDDRELSGFLQFRWIRAIDRVVPVFDPDHWILLAWNLVVLVAILYNLFMTPIVIFFTEQAYIYETQIGSGLAVSTICLIILYLDVLAQLNTGYIDKGKLIKHRELVLIKYVRFQFWLDLLSIIAVTVYVASNDYSYCYVRLVFYLRITSVIEIDKQFMQSLGITRFWLIAYRFVRMTVLLWFLTSWAACVFFAIDYYYYQEQGTYYSIGQLWLTNSQAVNNLDIIAVFPWYTWYEYALYWSVQTSSTIGYGDLTAKNPQQIIYCNFVMLLMTVLFAYFINNVWEIIGELQQGPLEYTNHWHHLRLYLYPLSLSRHTKEKVGNYMHEVFKGNDKQQVQSLIIQEVSDELKHQFLVHTRIRFYRAHGYFNTIFRSVPDSSQIWQSLVEALEDCCVGEESMIYVQGQYDPSLYYLRSGFVKLQIRRSELGKSVQANQMFGAQQFFTSIVRNHEAQSITFVHMWKLNYQQMRSCLKADRFIYETFCKFSDSINIEKESINLQVGECWRCLTRDHFIQRCPISTFQKTLHFDLVNLVLDELIVAQRAPFNRPTRKSKRITNIKLDHDRNYAVDVAINYTHYNPSYNIINFANINRNSM